LRKTLSLDVSGIGVKFHGDPNAELTLVGWGSTKPVILDVISWLKEDQGVDCNFLQVIYMEPFPTDHVAKVIGNAKRTMLVENNATGQLGNLIRQKTGLVIEDKILKYNGRQFFRDELADLIQQRL
jgi:2-oxoglutarate ferredoxin oxidoreductase subunit alpha